MKQTKITESTKNTTSNSLRSVARRGFKLASLSSFGRRCKSKIGPLIVREPTCGKWAPKHSNSILSPRINSNKKLQSRIVILMKWNSSIKALVSYKFIFFFWYFYCSHKYGPNWVEKIIKYKSCDLFHRVLLAPQ